MNTLGPHSGDVGDDFMSDCRSPWQWQKLSSLLAPLEQKTATARYNATEAAATEFFTFLDDEPAAGERPSPVEDPWPQDGADHREFRAGADSRCVQDRILQRLVNDTGPRSCPGRPPRAVLLVLLFLSRRCQNSWWKCRLSRLRRQHSVE